jgi:hypothetical protein
MNAYKGLIRLLFRGFPLTHEQFLWYLQGIRGKLKTNRTTVRIRPQVLKKFSRIAICFCRDYVLIRSW